MQNDDGEQCFAEVVVGYFDNGGFGDGGVVVQGCFDF